MTKIIPYAQRWNRFESVNSLSLGMLKMEENRQESCRGNSRTGWIIDSESMTTGAMIFLLPSNCQLTHESGTNHRMPGVLNTKEWHNPLNYDAFTRLA